MLQQKEIEEKINILKKIKQELKLEFFGIDECIDKIIESIKIWYIMPSIIFRPVIINLFGLTGIGKTDLVRKLVDKLEFNNYFVEIQMDTTSKVSFGEDSICSILESSSIEQNFPGIIFLDEFQRFRTISNIGEDVPAERFQDIWQLLSDGNFSNDYSILSKLTDKIAYMNYDFEYQDENNKKKKTKKEQKRKFNISPYEAKYFKKLLKLNESLEEIMTFDMIYLLELVKKHSQNKNNGIINFSKCLIFIAGNLDEAFKMSEDIDDCDITAESFYQQSKKIGIIDIKKALLSRFKPEQISRLGNNFIIYPSLNTEAYMKIIKKECNKYLDETKNICNIKFDIKENLYSQIYENSVYPAQGTRPVFSSIHKIFASTLSDGIFWALQKNYKEINIDIDIKESFVKFSNKKDILKVKIELDLRELRNKRTKDFNALIAVHESGHAILYGILTKRIPREISINAHSFSNGYILYDVLKSDSKNELLNKICIGFGGTVAEEIIFGKNLISSGCGADIMTVTQVASSFIRKYGMDKYVSYIQETEENVYNENIKETNENIENILFKQKEISRTIILNNKQFLLDLSKELLKVKKMDSKMIFDFFKKYINDVCSLEENLEVAPEYNKILTKNF